MRPTIQFTICAGRRGSVRPRGYSLVELLVALGIVALLMGFVLSAVGRTRDTATRLECLAHLQQIGVAFNLYATENHGYLPDPSSSERSWEKSLARYLGNNPYLYQCGADYELYPSVGSSYDWRDTGQPATTLAGRKVTDVNRGPVVLAFEALPGWHTPKKMIAVRLDGSAEVMDQEECLADLTRPVR